MAELLHLSRADHSSSYVAGQRLPLFVCPAATARLSDISRPACVAKNATSAVRLMSAESKQPFPLFVCPAPGASD
ncbi:hypothetical protein [Bacillus sp. Hm123]|uniref:hypothetical protein n=1 Tax=Bacillus sp. Hm123 TaxID=3450745 RepID=UPI003F4448A9